eukprot:scaffold30611_cov35-Tisochrysis_lutea.AAC.1
MHSSKLRAVSTHTGLQQSTTTHMLCSGVKPPNKKRHGILLVALALPLLRVLRRVYELPVLVAAQIMGREAKREGSAPSPGMARRRSSCWLVYASVGHAFWLSPLPLDQHSNCIACTSNNPFCKAATYDSVPNSSPRSPTPPTPQSCISGAQASSPATPRAGLSSHPRHPTSSDPNSAGSCSLPSSS